MTLNIGGLLLLFFVSLGFIITLRALLHKFVEKHQRDVILSSFKQNLNNYVFNISTCTLIALFS